VLRPQHDRTRFAQPCCALTAMPKGKICLACSQPTSSKCSLKKCDR
jgi:hypothetical protein